MKKISDLLKPFLSVIFGALLFLCYFNSLSGEGGTLAIGIVAVIFAAYYITVGLLGSLLGEKFPKKTKAVLEGIGIGLFPFLLCTVFLVVLIYSVSNEYIKVGPMAWTIAIYSIAVSISLGALFLFAFFMKSRTFTKLAFLFSMLFVLALVLDVLVVNGNPATLGSIVVLEVVLYGVYTAMLLGALSGMKDQLKAPKAEAIKEEEAK